MKLVLGQESQRFYWTGRMVSEVGAALQVIGSNLSRTLPDYSNYRNAGCGARQERICEVFTALRLLVTPEAAKRFEKSDTICIEGQLHMLVFPSGTCLSVPRSIIAYLRLADESDGKPANSYQDICSIR